MSISMIIGVALATAVRMGLGMLWYSPKLFGGMWQEKSGITPEPQDVTPAMIGAFVTAFFTSATLYYVLCAMQVTTVLSGAFTGLLIWFGFVGSIAVHSVFFAKKPIGLFLINTGYDAVSFVVSGALIAWFL